MSHDTPVSAPRCRRRPARGVAIVDPAAPERMVCASNWPHPSFKKKFPDEGSLLVPVADWTQDEALRRKILVANPANLYGF